MMLIQPIDRTLLLWLLSGIVRKQRWMRPLPKPMQRSRRRDGVPALYLHPGPSAAKNHEVRVISHRADGWVTISDNVVQVRRDGTLLIHFGGGSEQWDVAAMDRPTWERVLQSIYNADARAREIIRF